MDSGVLRSQRCQVADKLRVDVTLSQREAALIALAVELGGHGDKAGALRALSAQGAREMLARIAPAKLAEHDRRFGGAE